MNYGFLFETEEIDQKTFEKFEVEEISYCYFSASQKYYLFGFQKEVLDLNYICQLIQVKNHLDSRKRKIRSIRGFILYALDIMGEDKEFQILKTNLEPFFWKNVRRIINQNKKGGLENFLFPKEAFQEVEIRNLKNKIYKLEKENIQLKNQLKIKK